MRLSCITSKFFWVVLETLMYFNGVENDSSLREQNKGFLVQRDDGISSFLTLTRRHWSLQGHPKVSLEVVEDPSDSQKRSLSPSPRIGCSRIRVGVLNSWSPPTHFIRPSATAKVNFPFSFGNITSFALGLLEISHASIVSNSSMSATNTSPFQIHPTYPRDNPSKTFFPN